MAEIGDLPNKSKKVLHCVSVFNFVMSDIYFVISVNSKIFCIHSMLFVYPIPFKNEAKNRILNTCETYELYYKERRFEV